MESGEQTYRALTGIDIEEQKRLWDARGKGYYGEYLVFSEIYQNVIGDAKILMNLQVPTPDGKITEIDLLLLHESGIYIFEMKHYKGTIYGDDNGKIWTQYFRTVKNQHFNNPIHQNQYHVEAIKEMFPSLPVQSCIVFTNPECELRVTVNSKDVKVCSIHALKMLFSVSIR